MIKQSCFSQFLGVCRGFSRINLRAISVVAVAALLLVGPVLQTDVQADPDVDLPTISFSQSSYAVNEGYSATLKVKKNGAGAASVNYTTADSTGSNPATANDDYDPVSGTLDFADGDTEKTFTVTAKSDAEANEASETLFVRLSLPDDNHDPAAELKIPATAVVVILNCSTPC